MSEAGKPISSPAADAPSGKLLGLRQLEAEPGDSHMEFQARDALYNPAGVVQGGFLAAMLDFTMGGAARSVVERTKTQQTLEMKISLIQPVKAGKLIGKGRVLHKGRAIIFAEGALSTEDGTLVATGTSTWRIVTRPDGARRKKG